ncbi:MAG TPA: TonB-dependent siderophore receptor [Candidatus Aquabacterium excrementipullorum]|nr:TonB-dependent siderophore receptor [Candidatus Aquabacterium excrementipullorum]
MAHLRPRRRPSLSHALPCSPAVSSLGDQPTDQASALRLKAPALAASLLISLMAGHAMAQNANGASATTQATQADAALPGITVIAPAAREARASITGLGNTPAWQAPVQAMRLTQDVLKDQQVQRLADLVKLDASTSDSYNTTGYWDYLSVRGFTLDNAYNYRREGLPINAETRLALDNKAAVELLKGTSGMQAGVSAPGGLVNLIVKRPEGRVRTAEIGFTGGSSVMAAVDIGDRFGTDQRFGLRVNAAVEKLAPNIDNTDGHRRLVAVATDWVIAPGSVVEAEFEHSLYSQPSVPGFSLLGSTLPSASSIDPSRNLNNHQPWAKPVEMAGNTGTLRWKQDWGTGWHSAVTYGEQHLRSNDRAAFPSGCFNEGNFDRYCSDGTFDLYDYRSEGESRVTRALNAQLNGEVRTGSVKHALNIGLLRSIHTTDLNTAAFNYVGEGNIDGNYGAYDPSPDLTYPGVDRHERSTELSLSDAITITEQWSAWAGLRHTWLKRKVELTDQSRAPASLDQQVTTPWLAVGYTFAPRTQVYASWGEGFEARTAMSTPLVTYDNAPQALPVHKSRQVELGIKAQHDHLQWGANLFRIERPEAGPVDNAAGGIDYTWDGNSLNQGAEGFVQTQLGAWTFNGSAMVLDAKRRDTQSGLDGKRPVNVPEHTFKLSGSYRWASPLPITAQADVVNEGRRWVDPDNTVRLPSWTRVDVGLKALQRVDGTNLTWRLGVTNLFDKRAWREAPTLTGHIYLFPMAARTVTGSLQVDF